MYISKQNLTTDKDDIIEFITQYNFATIITTGNGRPNASHLPFVIENRGDKTILIGHFAKANPQWKELLNNEILVVFAEPHAYISPKHYDNELSVPTWNYIAVHAYGKASILNETTQMLEVMEKSINAFEADYMKQWNKLPEEFKLKMLNGIVAFEIEVSSFEASKKLSQNKTTDEQHRIIESLESSEHDLERQIGNYMKKALQKINKSLILFVLCLLMYSAVEVNAQQLLPINEKSYTDSLQSILQSGQSDSIKARTSYLLSDYWRSKDTVKSKEYLIKGQAMGNKYPLVKALYRFYEGQYYFTHNTSKAAEAFMRAEKELSAFKDKEIYKFRSASWFNYAIMKKTEKGDAFVIDITINKAIPLSEKGGDIEKTAHYYSQLGTLLMYNGKFDKAEIYNNKAISLLEGKYPNSSILLHAYLAATSNYCYQLKKVEAKSVLDKAGNMLKAYPKSINYPNYYYNEVIYLTLTNQFDKALTSLAKAIPLAKEYNQTMLWQMLVFRKYEVFMRLKQFNEAKAVLLGLLKEGPLVADVNSRKTIYDQLAKTNANMGLMGEAYKWSIAYSKISDSLNDSKLKENISALEVKFRNAENQKMITQLEAENQKAVLSSKNTRLANWLLGSALIFLIVMAVFILYYYRNKAKLISTNAILEGEERERTRVARDLHDGLGGMLAGVKINLSGWAENQGDNINHTELNRIIGQLDNSVKELRHIARNMMPETLLKFGLETALKDLCESVMTNNITVSFQALSVQEKISTKTQLTIYRIVQELLSNAIRHANASNIIVQCSQNNESFYITIEDNGNGFDPTIAGKTKSMGLLNIRNRIELLRGKMNIESIVDEGTVVNIELNSSYIE